MSRKLDILLLEDVETDAELVLRELRKAGMNVCHRIVWAREEFESALATRLPDIILSDYSMPQFSALDALAIVRERSLDIPFILYTGTQSEEVAVECMKRGADDYLLKSSLTRLPTAVLNAIEKHAARQREREAIAERQRMQAQLLLADRLASVGTLAAGVAHEINNPLGSLMANLDLLTDEILEMRRLLDAPSSGIDLRQAMAKRLDDIDEPLAVIKRGADRVRLVVRDLMHFSRADQAGTTLVDVREVLEFTLKMAHGEIKQRARVVREYGEVPPVRGNESRIGQIFLNLIINAAHAIPKGRPDQNHIRVATHQETGKVIVEVEDTGCGIPPELQRRVFDPFFTTKPVGEGTGLGLAICLTLVNELGGGIHLHSEPSRGTTFFVTLPAAPVADTGSS